MGPSIKERLEVFLWVEAANIKRERVRGEAVAAGNFSLFLGIDLVKRGVVDPATDHGSGNMGEGRK